METPAEQRGRVIKREHVYYIYIYMYGQSAPLTLWSNSCIQGIKKGEYTTDSVPRVTSLYTLLNLTGMDVRLWGRATVEREPEWKRKVGHHALHWVTLVRFAERAWHPSVFLPPASHALVFLVFFFFFLIIILKVYFYPSRLWHENSTDQISLLLTVFPAEGCMWKQLTPHFAYCRLYVFNAALDAITWSFAWLSFNWVFYLNRLLSVWVVWLFSAPVCSLLKLDSGADCPR